MTEFVNVLVIDDHPLFRAALELALNKAKIDIENIDSSNCIAHALTLMKSKQYDLVLLDLNLSDSHDFEGFTKIKAADENVPIMIVSATETKRAFSTAKSLGAAGYIPKSSDLKTISNSIQFVLNGGSSFPAASEAPEGIDAAEKLSSLTPAQHRVMNNLSDGLLNKQIAFEMGISEATVKAHMTAIFRKLGANNRTQALLIFRNATRL
ncbi:MAG: response regulator transcription factor [Maricaulaceae bacterium]